MLKALMTVLLLAAPLTASAGVVTVTDYDILPGATVNWTSNNTYILDGFVFVDDGATLNIEAGTVIKGKAGQGEDASALIVARGGKIYAEGTAQEPIIFTGEVGSVDRLEAGDLKLLNNIWYAFGAGTTFDTIAKEDYTAIHLASNANTIADPMLRGISRTTDGGLDPRPESGSPVYSDLSPIPEDIYFTDVNYKGAFGGNNWLKGWTALDAYGYLAGDSNPVAVEEDPALMPQAVTLIGNYPNPFNPVTSITFSLTEAGTVNLTVYDALGRKVDTLVDRAVMSPGMHSIEWRAGNHGNGVYF